MHQLGATRSSLKADHLLQTPDTFIRTPLPGATGVEFIVHTAPRLGAAFTMMTAEFAEGGKLGDTARASQRFLYVLEGKIEIEWEGFSSEDTNDTKDDDRIKWSEEFESGGFIYLPGATIHKVRALTPSKTVVIEKEWQQPQNQVTSPKVHWGKESSLPSEPLGGDESLQVKRLIPDEVSYDFAVNTMTYDPGATLSQVEIHVMEHGLLMLEGGGIYRLGDNWYPVTSGDFIWMAPYCPQWFGALGKTPAKYLIYKDWYRHPLGV